MQEDFGLPTKMMTEEILSLQKENVKYYLMYNALIHDIDVTQSACSTLCRSLKENVIRSRYEIN